MDLQFLQVRQVLEHIRRQRCDIIHAEVTTGRKTNTQSVEKVSRYLQRHADLSSLRPERHLGKMSYI